MSIRGEYAIAAVGIGHVEADVQSWGADPSRVHSTLEQLAESVQAEEALPGAEPTRGRIAKAIGRLLDGEPIGAALHT